MLTSNVRVQKRSNRLCGWYLLFLSWLELFLKVLLKRCVCRRCRAFHFLLPIPRGSPWANPGHHGEDKHARDIPFLDEYADRQWEVWISVCVCVSVCVHHAIRWMSIDFPWLLGYSELFGSNKADRRRVWGSHAGSLVFWSHGLFATSFHHHIWLPVPPDGEEETSVVFPSAVCENGRGQLHALLQRRGFPSHMNQLCLPCANCRNAGLIWSSALTSYSSSASQLLARFSITNSLCLLLTPSLVYYVSA